MEEAGIIKAQMNQFVPGNSDITILRLPYSSKLFFTWNEDTWVENLKKKIIFRIYKMVWKTIKKINEKSSLK